MISVVAVVLSVAIVVLAFVAASALCAVGTRVRRRHRTTGRRNCAPPGSPGVVTPDPAVITERDPVTVAACDPSGPDDVDSNCERDEMTLVEQLLTGCLPRSEYQVRMAVLAVRDERRHPLSVPAE